MKRIGLISDTHSFLDPAIYKHFEECHEIWHAGDFGNLQLADELNKFRPLKGVYGNIDSQDIRRVYPETIRFKCEEVKVLTTHIGGYPGKYQPKIKPQLLSDPPKIFIAGHSHILKVIFDPKINCLHLNPGAAGKTGWHKVRTLLRFSINETKVYDLEVIELGKR